MRILVVSDLHYTLRQLDWVVESASGFDLVVLAGDHLDLASTVALDSQIVVVLDYFRMLARKAKAVVVSSGNHDLSGPDAHGEQTALWMQQAAGTGVRTDGDSLVIGDTLITICKWWDGPVGREAVAAQLAADGARRPKRWLWVYHWPPTDSTTSWTGRRHYGDPDLAAWIAEHSPDVVLAGHVHQPPFKPEGSWIDRIGDTWVFNPGRQIGEVPARIEIDTDRSSARWISLAGTEIADLTAAAAPARSVI